MSQSIVDYSKFRTSSSFKPPDQADDEPNSDGDQLINTEKFKELDIFRSDTPETVLTDCSIKPDITLQCDICSDYISIRNLPNHRAYHKALTTLSCNHPLQPADVKTLLQKRSVILNTLKVPAAVYQNQLLPQYVRKIDAAYEVLKKHLEDVSEEISFLDVKVDTDVKAGAFSCSLDCIYAVGICSSKNSRWKSCMEDVQVYQDYFGDDKNKCYLAMFDGYHGPTAAERSGRELHRLLLQEMATFDSKIKSTVARNFAESVTARMDYEMMRPETRDSIRVSMHQDSTEIVQNIVNLCYEKYDKVMEDNGRYADETQRRKRKIRDHMTEHIHNAFKKSYHLMDIILSYGISESSKVRWSGTSALTITIQNVKLNAPDSDNIVSPGEQIDGRERNSDVTADSVEPSQVLGLIHVANAGNSRALLVQDGKPIRLSKDHTAKNLKERKRVLSLGGTFSSSERDGRVNGVLPVTRGLGSHGDKKLKHCVIVDPHVLSVPIQQHAQFLVIASNGVWEVFSDQEVASLLVKMLPDQQIPPPSRISESLIPLLQHGNTSSSTSRVCSTKSEPDFVAQEDQNKPDNLQLEQNLLTKEDESSLKTTVTDCCEDTQLQHITSNEFNDEYLTLPSPQDVIEEMQVKIDDMSRDLSKSMAEQLTQAALLAGAKDNLSVIVVLFSTCGI